MQLGSEQLASHLKRGLAPVYLVSGDEPLLAAEACDAIRAAARAAGYAERELHTVEPGFDWDALYAASQSLSLFASRRLVELRIPNAKPGEAGGKLLAELAERPPADSVLLVVTGKLERQAREAKWVKALERAGVAVTVYPLEAAQLPAWIARRLAARGLRAGPGVAELLAHYTEGNPLAAAQEIDKLAMRYGEAASLSADDIAGDLGDNARYNVFGLADACLQGEAVAIRRILAGLRAEGVEPVLVLWALARELRELGQMAAQIERGQALAAVMEERRVWARRRPLVSRALKRLGYEACLRLLRRAARADRVAKGRRAGDVWQELECLALGLGGRVPPTCL